MGGALSKKGRESLIYWDGLKKFRGLKRQKSKICHWIQLRFSVDKIEKKKKRHKLSVVSVKAQNFC